MSANALDATTFAVLHAFTPNSDSQTPGPLVASGSILYGETSGGGSGFNGTVYKINTDGTGYQVLHTFSGSDGSQVNSLMLAGSTLYGTTSEGGTDNSGVIFQMNTDGTAFKKLYSFDFRNGSDNSSHPSGPLTLVGSTLYGTTMDGGPVYGNVFRVNTDGTGFRTLHSFNGGGAAHGSLLPIGSTLYGTTANDGGFGTLYEINMDGTGYQVLHQFVGGATDGSEPMAGLTIVGSTFFGTTWAGGVTNHGTLFELNTDGTEFHLLHSFSTGAVDGALLDTPLTLVGSTLYGTSSATLGNTATGTVFQINTDGTGYEMLYTRTGGSFNLVDPSPLIAIGSTFFGTTEANGTDGTLFAMTVPEPAGLYLTLIGVAALTAMLQYRRQRIGSIRGGRHS